ncbi:MULTISPECIES: hypothetical protein [Bacillaceae]|uniref:hypothetical protein n=1 Tax=Bacillaceae TaxID=186817 RepID=UPI002FFE19E5
MNEQDTNMHADQVEFSEIVRKAYLKGQNESELTLDELIKDLKEELKHLLIG